MIRVIKVNELPSKFSIDNVEFNINIIKKYMKDNNSNTLYLLNNPYEKRFFINNDDLNGLINDEIYCMVNLPDKQLENTKTNDRLQDKNTDYNISKHFTSDTDLHLRILEEDNRTHIFSKTISKITEKFIQFHEKMSEESKHPFKN